MLHKTSINENINQNLCLGLLTKVIALTWHPYDLNTCKMMMMMVDMIGNGYGVEYNGMIMMITCI